MTIFMTLRIIHNSSSSELISSLDCYPLSQILWNAQWRSAQICRCYLPISEYLGVIVSWSISQRRMTGFSRLFGHPYQYYWPALVVHSRVRDTNLVNNFSEDYTGSDYQKSLIDKWGLKSLMVILFPWKYKCVKVRSYQRDVCAIV